MKVFGYTIDKSLLDEQLPFDEYAKPYFHKGSDVGCIVMHGIGGTPANVRIVSDALEKAGFSVDVPLLPGHGETIRKLEESTGEQWLQEANNAYDRLKDAGCREIYAIGLSLGGILATLIAASRPCAGLVAISAPYKMKFYLRFSKAMRIFFPHVSYSEKDVKRIERNRPWNQMYHGFSTKKLKDLQKLINKAIRNLGKITCPVFAIWAKYDNKVDPKSAQILKKGLRVQNFSEHMMERSPHGSTYGKEKEEVARLVCEFVCSVSQKEKTDA